MNVLQRIQPIFRAIRQQPRHFLAAGIVALTPAAAMWGSQSAGATSINESVPTVQEDCGAGVELPPCPTTTTTTQPPETTTTTTQPPETTTTTTQPPETTTTTTPEPPVRVPTCEDARQFLLLEEEIDPVKAYWNAVNRFSEYFEKSFDDTVEFFQQECDLCPPEIEIPPTTTIPDDCGAGNEMDPCPTTTTTTTTTEPPATTTTTEPAPTTTTTTLIVPTTTVPPTVPPAPPATPAPTGPAPTLPYTGAATLGLVQAGGGLIVTGAGLVAVAGARRKQKAQEAQEAKTIKVIAGAGPNPDLEPIELEIQVPQTPEAVIEPLTGVEIDETDIDVLAEDLVKPEARRTNYRQGENRDASLKGYNIPDGLIPASLRLNPNQSTPARDTWDGRKGLGIPERYFDRMGALSR